VSSQVQSAEFLGLLNCFARSSKGKKSDQLAKLVSIMFPWHELVCQRGKVDLVSAAQAFLRQAGMRGDETTPRQLPHHITRLIELADQIRDQDYPTYLGDEYWSTSGAPEDISGIALFRDLREL